MPILNLGRLSVSDSEKARIAVGGRDRVDAAEGIGFSGDDPRLLVVIALANPEITAPSVRRRLARLRLQELADPLAETHGDIAAEKAGDAERASTEAATLARETRQPQFGLTGQLIGALAAALRAARRRWMPGRPAH